MCLSELTIVDDTLEALEVPKEYQRLHNWIIRIIIGWIVLIFYYIAYDNFIYNVFLNYGIINSWRQTLYNFPLTYLSCVIILSALISTAIFGLVLYMCIHLLWKLFLMTLCVKMFTVWNTFTVNFAFFMTTYVKIKFIGNENSDHMFIWLYYYIILLNNDF